MTTGGLHLLSGLIFSSFIRDEKYKKAKWGIVWGSIFPDIDLFLSIIAFLITQDFGYSEFLHRSYTHGFFAIGLVATIGFAISRTKDDLKWVSMFSFAFAFGMITHTFYDLLDGYVAILAPFSFTRYSITGCDFQSIFGDTGMKLWNAWDAMSDVIFFLLLWYWASYKSNLNTEKLFAKKLLIFSFIFIAYFSFLMVFAFTDISVEMHFILIYLVWGLFSLPLSSVIAHIKMRQTIQEFNIFNLRQPT